MLSRWPDAHGRIGAESVMSYIQYLRSECRQLTARVRSLEDCHDTIREQLHEERRERVNWLSGTSNDASQRLNEPVRKRRRERE
jgi:prefoldin subunit 5